MMPPPPHSNPRFLVWFSLFSMTRLGNTKKNRIIEVSSSHQHDKWRKVVVILREYENISNMSFKTYTTSLSNIDGVPMTPKKYKYSQEFLK